MVRTLRIHEQLNAAVALAGWSCEDLATKSKLGMNRSLVWKKLNGRIPMSTREAEAFADTLRKHGVVITLVWPAAKCAA